MLLLYKTWSGEVFQIFVPNDFFLLFWMSLPIVITIRFYYTCYRAITMLLCFIINYFHLQLKTKVL